MPILSVGKQEPCFHVSPMDARGFAARWERRQHLRCLGAQVTQAQRGRTPKRQAYLPCKHDDSGLCSIKVVCRHLGKHAGPRACAATALKQCHPSARLPAPCARM